MLLLLVSTNWFLGPIADFGNRFVEKNRLKRTKGSRISARFLTAMVWQVSTRLILYLVEDPGELKQVARNQWSRLQHPFPSRRPLQAGGQALVPAGVWAESPAGLYTLILSYRKRPWVGSRDLGRAPPGAAPGIPPGKRLHTLPLCRSPLTVARKLTWLCWIVFITHSVGETRRSERKRESPQINRERVLFYTLSYRNEYGRGALADWTNSSCRGELVVTLWHK